MGCREIKWCFVAALMVYMNRGCFVTQGLVLNIAVHPSVDDVIYILERSLHKINVSLNKLVLPQGSHLTDYRRIVEALNILQTHSTHVAIGPFDKSVAIATDQLNITYLSTTEVPENTYPSTFQVAPRSDRIYQVIADYVSKNEWEYVNIYYDDHKDITLAMTLSANSDLNVRASHVSTRYMNLTKQHLANTKQPGGTKSIVLCSEDNLKQLFKMARSLAVLGTPNEWILYDRVGELEDVLNDYRDTYINLTLVSTIPFKNYTGTLEQAITKDALGLLEKTLYSISGYVDVKGALASSLTNIQYDGITGNIRFDVHRQRLDLTVYLTEVSSLSTRRIGTWQSGSDDRDGSFQILPAVVDNSTGLNLSSIEGKIFNIVTILEKPFCMLKKDHRGRMGNDKYEGFAIDLIQALGIMLKFDFKIYLVNDGNFGSQLPDGSWNGMIGEVLSANASMAVAPLSINAQRAQAVDFTKPFMTRSITAVMKVTPSGVSYFQFLEPVHYIVWICTLGAIVTVSILLYIFERVNGNNTPPDVLMGKSDSAWYVIGLILRGGTKSDPSSLPGKIMISFWWFFAFLFVSSYTANLAAFLTIRNINVPVQSITDLAGQRRVQYGTVQNSGVARFFKTTQINYLAKMWSTMTSFGKDGLVADSNQGFERVRNGDFVLIWDSTVIKYETANDCNLIELGPAFDNKGFGIALPPASVYREDLTMAILKLSDNGTLQAMENRWWSGRKCELKTVSEESARLDMNNVAGIFFIIVFCAILGVVVGNAQSLCKRLAIKWQMSHGNRDACHVQTQKVICQHGQGVELIELIGTE